MKLIGTLTIPQEGLSDELQFAKFIPEGVQADGLKLRVKGPLKNIGGAGYTPTATDLLNWVKHCLSSVLGTYGEGDGHTWLNALNGALLRSLYRFMEEDEFTTDVITGGAIGAGATVTRQFTILIPFIASKYQDIPRRPGTTQLRTMKLSIQEDGNKTILAAQLERGVGNVTIDVVPVFRPGPDTWSPLLTVGQYNISELEVEGDDGLTVAVWDENGTQAGIGLTRFDCQVGQQFEHQQIEPFFVGDEYYRELDQGGANVTDTVAVLYYASKKRPLHDSAHGRPRFRQNTQELASWKIRQLYYPVLGEAEKVEAGRVKAKSKDEPILVSTEPVPFNAHPGAAACAPVRLIMKSAPEFHLRAGILVLPDGSTQHVVPDSVVAAAKSAVNAEGNRMAKDAAARKAQKLVARQLGAVTTAGNKSNSPATQSVKGRLASLFNF